MTKGQVINLIATICTALAVVGGGVGVYATMVSDRAVANYHIEVIEHEISDIKNTLSQISQTVIRTERKTEPH